MMVILINLLKKNKLFSKFPSATFTLFHNKTSSVVDVSSPSSSLYYTFLYNSVQEQPVLSPSPGRLYFFAVCTFGVTEATPLAYTVFI